MSAPLLGENHKQERRPRGQHGSFIRQFRVHPMNALSTSVSGLRNKMTSVRGSTHHKKLLPVDSKCSPAIETSLQGAGTPPPPSPPQPPLTSLSQDMSQFDFEGSTNNYFKSLDSANVAKSDDLSFSDDGVNLWELASTQDTEEIDFLLTRIMNNSPMYIRRTEDPIRDSISPYEDDTIEENHCAIQETRTADVTVNSFSAWHNEEGKLDAFCDLAREPEELSVDPGDTTLNGPGGEEEDPIPDVFLLNELNEAAVSLNVAEGTNTKNEDVDSALAWSALSFILGSPAPASVTKRSSRRESAKLWKSDAGAECDEIPDLLTTGDALDCVGEGILEPPGVFRVTSFLQTKKGIQGADQNDTFTTSSLTSDDTSLNRSMVDIDTINAVGSLGDEEEDSISDVFVLNEEATSLNVAEGTNTKNEDFDSVLAWSALSFILGSPTPASVTKKNSRKERAKLWGLDAGAECDDIPDLCVTP